MIPYLDTARELAERAVPIIRQNFGLNMKKEWKEDDTPVTDTDREVNSLVLKVLRERYPDHDVLAEEESDTGRGSEYVWVCDPIDGTIPFSHGIPTCVFAVSLVRDGVPVLGVIADPFFDRTIIAEQGSGAFLNGERVRVSEKTEVKGGLIGLSGTTNPDLNYFKVYQDLRKEGARLLNLHTSQYVALLVSCGEVLGLIDGTRNPHDAAAVNIVVREAGAKITNLRGEVERYDGKINGSVIANPSLHEKLMRYVVEGRAS